MKITKYQLLLAACPFPVQWETAATNLKAAVLKAKKEIETHFNLKAGRLIEYKILSQKEI